MNEKTKAVLRPKAATDYLQVSAETMRRWRRTGGGPKFIRLGEQAIGYLISDLNDWLVSRGEGLGNA